MGFCTTLSYVAFTHIESMIGDGDANPENIAIDAACSLTRFSYLLRAANI